MDHQEQINDGQVIRGLRNAAAYAHVSTATVRKWIASGRLKCSRPSANIILITKKDMEDCLYGRL